jgi:hypothetical protein
VRAKLGEQAIGKGRALGSRQRRQAEAAKPQPKKD